MSQTVLVFTMNGGKGKWSRYIYPFSVDAFAQLGDDLYIRSGDTIKRVSEQATTDVHLSYVIPFAGWVQWAWLDFGSPGVTKMMEGFDIVSDGSPSVSVGFDQRDGGAFTVPYAVPPDTLPGNIIPLPLSAPSLAVRVDFAGGQKWSLMGVNLYLHDNQAAT